MERFTLETGLEETILEFQQVNQTIYEAMIKADENEIKMQNKAKLEGTIIADELVAYQEAIGEKMASATKSVGNFLKAKIEAFIKLIHTYVTKAVEVIKKKVLSFSSKFSSSNKYIEIVWYKDTTKIKSVSMELSNLLRDIATATADDGKVFKLSSNLDEIEKEVKESLEKETIKLSECDELNTQEKINKSINYLLNAHQKVIDGLEYCIKIEKNAITHDEKDGDANKFIAKANGSSFIRIMNFYKEILMDYGKTLNAAVSKIITQGNHPAQGQQSESAMEYNADLIYEAMLYEFDHLMDGIYVDESGELINTSKMAISASS